MNFVAGGGAPTTAGDIVSKTRGYVQAEIGVHAGAAAARAMVVQGVA